MGNEQSNKRIAKNTLVLYFRMILTMLVSLYTSRVVLNTLGVEDYGTYNVVGGVVTMFGFFNGAMSSATQRFLSFDLGRGDYLQLRKTFNATLIIHTVIAILVFILAETVGLWFVNTQLNLPEGRIEAARWVYHFSVLTFMVSIIQVPYNAVIIARERMNVYAYASILEALLKLFIVFMLTWIAFDKLKLYGILLFAVSFIVASIYRIYGLKQFDETHFELVIDKTLYKTLISYSGWNLFGGVAAISKVQGASIILNIFFGTVVNAAQGVANQVSGSINMFVSNFQMASNPQIIKSYAAEDKEYMTNLVIRTARFSFCLLFIPTLPVILEIEYILKLWLKIVPEYTAVFTILILINVLIDTISGPLMTSIQATGKIKTYQAIVGILLILILPVSYVFFRLGFPPYFTFIVSIAVSVLALAFRLLLTKRQIPEFSARSFLKKIVIKNFLTALLSVIFPMFIFINMQAGFQRLIIVTSASLLSSILVVYFIGLKNNERMFVKNAIKVFASKVINEK
ncbi:MAG: lipopolysaccharide biosynthesis protein [Mangrovibacterium sp.]